MQPHDRRIQPAGVRLIILLAAQLRGSGGTYRESKRPVKTVVFDSETVLNVAAAERCRYEANPDEFAPWALHTMVCISWLTIEREDWDRLAFSIESVSRANMSERAMLDEFEQQIVDANVVMSYNGLGFDVPVFLTRASVANVAVPTIAQLRTRARPGFHLDMAEVIAGGSAAPRVKLAQICGALSIPCKTDSTGNRVEDLAATDDFRGIEAYCETDVVATWLLSEMWQTPQIPDRARERWSALAQWITDNQPRLAHLLPYSAVPDVPKGGGLLDDEVVF
jgi:predicted PolB exonuclease-like 3'-5' exonuclease